MKTNKLSLGTFAVLVLLTSITAWAQTSLPIVGIDRLRITANNNVVKGTKFVYSPSGVIDYSYVDTVTETNVMAVGAERVLEKLFASELVYKLLNTNDSVLGFVFLTDVYGNTLYFGNAEYNGNDLLQGRKPSYKLKMEEQPILSNVKSARVRALNEDGTTGKEFPLNVNSYAQAMWVPWMSGAPNAVLDVLHLDGTYVYYEVTNPMPNIVEKAFDQSSFVIPGNYYFKGSDIGTIQVIESVTLPTVTIDTTNAQSIVLDIRVLVGDQEERATRAYLVAYGREPASGDVFQELDPSGPTTIVVTYPVRLYFSFPTFGHPAPIYAGSEEQGERKAIPLEAIPTDRTESTP